MPIFVRFDASTGVTAVTLSGTATRSDYRKATPHLEAVADDSGPLKLLLVANGFEGWSPSSLRGEAMANLGSTQQISRIAICAPSEWRHILAETASRSCEARCRSFRLSESDLAVEWLTKPLEYGFGQDMGAEQLAS